MSAEHDHDHAPADFNRAFAIGIALNMVFVANLSERMRKLGIDRETDAQ